MPQKYVLVTGSSRGIGKSIALKFASEGWHVFLNCRYRMDALQNVKEEIEASTPVSYTHLSDKKRENYIPEKARFLL